MKVFKILAVCFMLAASVSASANGSNTVGNGGDMLVCTTSPYNGKILDYFQTIEELRLPVDLGPAILNWQSKVQFVLQRLSQVSPKRAATYSQWFLDFLNGEAEFVSGKTLVDIPDTGAVVLPADCEIKQVAVQRNEQELEIYPKRYTIDNDLWTNYLDEDQRAILVLHELVYRENLNSAISNSLFVRFLNGHIISSQISTIDQMALMIKAKRDYFEFAGHTATFLYHLDKPSFPLRRIFGDAQAIPMDYFNVSFLAGRKCSGVMVGSRGVAVDGINVENCSGADWPIDTDATVTFFHFNGGGHETREAHVSFSLSPKNWTNIQIHNGTYFFKMGSYANSLVIDGHLCMSFNNGPETNFYNTSHGPELSLSCNTKD